MTAIQCQPKRTIRFYGPLAKVLNRRSFSAVALNSASEVMRCLLSNFPQLVSHMRGRHYRVVMNGRAISKDELNDPVGDNHEIHIIPAICGAGGDRDNPLTQILAGVALIGAGLLLPFAAPFLTPLGIGLALQGVAEIISPTPNDTPESTDPSNRSYNFSNIQQTSREGVPVPLVYGEIVTGSVVLSVNIERDDEKLSTVFAAGEGDKPFVFDTQVLYQANLYATGCGLFTIPNPPFGQLYPDEEWYIPASNQICLWRFDSGNFDRLELYEAIILEPFKYKVQVLNVINANLDGQLITEGNIQTAGVAQTDSNGTFRGISFTHTGSYGPFLDQNNPPGSGNFNGYVAFNFFRR